MARADQVAGKAVLYVADWYNGLKACCSLEGKMAGGDACSRVYPHCMYHNWKVGQGVRTQ